MASVALTADTFEQTVNGDGIVLVDFWAEWCGPCKMIAPVLEELAGELDGKLTIGKLDVDHNPDTAMAFGVMSIPTLMIFKGGKVIVQMVGVQSKENLSSELKKALQ